MSVDSAPKPALRDDPRGVTHVAATCLVVGSLFLSQVVSGFYEGLERQGPEVWPPLSSFFVGMSIVAWFWSYSRQHGIGWVLDMGWFVLVAWVIIVPYYLLKREGKRGLSRIGLFSLTYFAAWATGIAVRIWVRVLTSG
jgi:hypothetical protein